MPLLTITFNLALWLGLLPSDTGQPLRSDHEILVHRVATTGDTTLVARIPNAAVPTICRMDDDSLIIAHQWFPPDIPDMFDHIAVHFSNDGGRTWTDATPAEIPGLPARTRFPFDPTIIRLPDGRMRMYFTFMQGNDPATSIPSIGSAISSNGINWTYERGDRFAVPDSPVMNCAVAQSSGMYELIAPIPPGNGQGGYSARSRDGLVFSRQDDLPTIGINNQWLGCLLETDGQLTFYGTSSNAGIWTASRQSDGVWKAGPSLPIPGSDPGVIQLNDGTLVVVTTNHDPSRSTETIAENTSMRDNPRPASREEIDNHLDKLVEASNNLDWDRFANTFAPSATGFLSTPARVHRLENGTELANAFKPSFHETSKMSDASYPLPKNPQNLTVQKNEKTAIATFQTDHQYNKTGWWTVVMKRQDEQSDWKVHHLHASIQDGTQSNSNKTSWP
ncbi:MAG: hypothetical protein CMJ40_05680 [Phycisphaerae bacterium]|nr:hypothetical protein [Phycisphaerae bacterium]|tara:strand:+ start:723 stop:2066 length:1344 start_codon:yes stop_codon:yes gene_type:complete